ncbi:MAG: chemotaxis protein CheA [Candidatus Cloacimonetes bacterium]|nr:chemotaxis protein CheA [Candidatus Cloacimonadota bacterium]
MSEFKSLFTSLCEELILLDLNNKEEIRLLQNKISEIPVPWDHLSDSTKEQLTNFLQLLAVLDSQDELIQLQELGLTIQKDLPEINLPKEKDPFVFELPEIDESRAVNIDKILNQDADLVSAFVAEANEHLESIDLQMLIWEKNPKAKDTINDIFRPFHTIKGISSFLDLVDIRDIAHALEDMLSSVRNGQIHYSASLANVIFAGVDYLKHMVKELEILLGGGTPQKQNIPVRSFVIAVRQALGENTKELEEQFKGGKSTRDKLLEAAMKQNPQPIEEVKKPASKPEPEPVTTIVSPAKQPALEPTPVTVSENQTNSPVKPAAKFMRVDTSKMDGLLDLVGELVISNNILQGCLNHLKIQDKRLLTELSQLRRVVNSLQHNALSLRMVPISNTFQKMQRIVRDIGSKLNKNIELVLEGEHTEVDRNIVDEIYEPLVHMVRNSCDHGIESKETRIQMGKSETGIIKLTAGHKDGSIVITISDNGKGLNPEYIYGLAVERGLIRDGVKLSPQEIYRLVLAPGFSTAKSVTEVSGRGVGMDIVMKALEKLRGSLDIDSTLNQGTVFTLKFPLTLAIMEGMIVQVQNEQYIIPTINIRESLKPLPENCVTMLGKGEMVKVRDHLIPLVRLHEYFKIEPKCHKPSDGIVVVVESDSRTYAVLVDHLAGKQEIVIKSLGEKFKNLKAIAGGAVLGDGRVGLILDIGQLVNTRLSDKG